MKLPNGDRAVVEDRKLYEFLVNREHPRQAGHAELFSRLLDVDASNAETLRSALLEAAAVADAEPAEASEFGSEYVVRFSMTGSRGSFIILSVWIIRRDELIPRLVTAFPEID